MYLLQVTRPGLEHEKEGVRMKWREALSPGWRDSSGSLAVTDLCGWPPCSTSCMGCWVICCLNHVGFAGNSLLSWLLPTLCLPPSALHYMHIHLHPIKTVQAWLPSSVHWAHGKCMAPCHSKLRLSLMFFSSPTSISIFYLLQWEAGTRLYVQQTPLNSTTSTSNTPENNSTVFFSREVRISAVCQTSSWGVRYC